MGLLQGVIMVALVVAVLCIVHLFDRPRRLELRQQYNATALVHVVNRLYTTILRPDPIELENLKAEDTGSAIKLIDHYIGHHLFHQVPALRRVMTFSIGVSLDYLNTKAGITVDDLPGLELQFSGPEGGPPTGFFPATSMVIEQWATHLVVSDYTGRLKVFYDDALFSYYDPPKVLWTRPIPPGEPVWRSGSLEVVLYQGCITCWAVDGRFERRIPPERVARNEYVLVSVPMKDEDLKPYRSAWDKPSDDPEIRVAQYRWIRHYEHVGPEENFRWNLVINDVVARVTGSGA